MAGWADTRPVVRAIVGRRARTLLARCTFCGTPCVGRACMGHTDLLDLEHEMTEPTALLMAERAAGSDEKGL